MAALPLEPARAWLQTQGWALSDYSITRSAIQSCPQGMVTLDCVWVVEGASKEERASRSRVLEVDAESGAVEAVLAARDTEQLDEILRGGGGGGDTELAMPPATAAPVPTGEECPFAQSPGEDEEMWARYRAGKEELAQTLRREGVAYFRSAAEGESRVGLLNQGATCYMNSLLQTLYMTQEFREYIFRWRYTPERDGPEDQCIALQLQTLFARLACSRCAAVSTKALTHSFGWEAAESFQQHDVQELNRVLFDALGRSSPEFAEVASHFTGRVNDYIQDVRWPADGCVRRCHEEEFMDIQLSVGPEVATVEDALRLYVTPEILDGENKWQASDSGEKVEAKKGLSFVSFPKVLTLHLKRFVFDYATMRRKKVNDPLQIGSTLDLRPFLSEEAETAATDDAMIYELYGILIHSGSAMGGHYHAYIKDIVDPGPPTHGGDASVGWFDYNDSQVTPLDLSALERMMCGTATASVLEDGETGATPEAGASAQNADTGDDLNDTQSNKSAVTEAQRWAGGSASNAYMLVYRRRSPDGADSSLPGGLTGLLPPEVQSRIASEGEQYSRLKELYEFQQKLVELRLCTTDGRSWDVELHQDSTLRAAVELARSALPSRTALDRDNDDGGGSDPYTETGGGVEWRLRHFSRMTGRAGQTFATNLLDSSLADIGLVPTGIGGRSFDLMLEVRHDNSPPFAEYNPNEMMIHVQLWDRQLAEPASTTLSIVVPGEQLATVGDLRAAVSTAYDLRDGSSKFWLVCPTAGSSKLDVLVIGDEYDNIESAEGAAEDSELEPLRANSIQQLRRDHKVWSGERFYLDVHHNGDESDGESTCAKHYEQQAYCVTIVFNCLENPEEFDRTLAVDLRTTVVEVKAQIAELLGLNIDTFHLRRGQRSPMIKTEDTTLQNLGLSEGSPIFVAPGRVLKDGEFVLKVQLLHAGALSFVAEIPASADRPTSALKEDVAATLGSSALPTVIAARESLGWEPIASRVRLRDCKGTEVGKVLQERKMLKSAISRLADGREVAVQLLSAEENVAESDIILSVRRWHVCDRKLDPAVDLIISKHSTFSQLRDTIATLADLEGFMPEAALDPDAEPVAQPASPQAEREAQPESDSELKPEPQAEPKVLQLRRLGLAKASAFGPPLDHRAAIKLKWNQSYPDEAMISTHPVSLRDGSLIVYVDEEDRAAAKAKAEAAKKAKGDGEASGSAKRAGRGRGARSRFQPFGAAQVGAPRGKAPTERGLQIHTRFDNEPTPDAEAPQSEGQPEAAVGE